jgi:hypothetical protein
MKIAAVVLVVNTFNSAYLSRKPTLVEKASQ